MKRESKSKDDIFETVKGITLNLVPFNVIEFSLSRAGLKEEMLAAGKPIDPPTYKARFYGDVEEDYPHDETTLEVKDNPEQTEENRAAWEAHQRALTEFRDKERDLAKAYALEDSITNEPPNDEWVKKAKRRHITVPDDPKARKAVWVSVEVLSGFTELWRLVGKCVNLSNFYNVGSKAEVSAAIEPFPNSTPADGEAAARPEKG